MFVKNNKASFKQGTILATLLGFSALYMPMNAEASTVSAKTSWAVSRVASASLGSYCTMAQKYSDDTVLTFAQNTKGEYSLALDFKDAKFKAGQKQLISIGVSGGKTKSFDVVPQSDKTAVLGIGNDSDFIKKISNSEKVNIKIESASSDFELSDFSNGQKELGICIDALQKPAETFEDAPQKSVTTTSPKPVIRKNEIVLKDKSENNEPSVEGLLAAMPKSSADITASDIAVIPVVPAKQKAVAAVEKSDASQMELADLRNENARLSRALSEQRRAFEDKQASGEGAALSELRQKLDSAVMENKSLRGELDKLDASKISSKSDVNAAKLTESVKALQQENQTLKNQIQIYANAKNGKDSNAEDLAKIQTENADLKLQIATLKAAQKTAPVVANNSSDAEVNKLRADNRKLGNELDLIKSEKETLQTQVTSLQKDVEGKQLKMSGGSWDLEQATRRYQESQREIIRLGSLIQSQDVKCANEKKDIEYMLFDPAIATKAQIAMLNSMEDQIKDKDAQLTKAELDLAAAKSQASPDKDAKIAELQSTVAQAKLELSEKTQLLFDAQEKVKQAQVAQANMASKDQNLVSLKTDYANQAQQLADAQVKIQQMQKIQSDLASKDQSLASLKADVDLKTQQLVDAQTKIQQATAQSAVSAQKAAEVETLKTQLAQVQTQLAMEQENAKQINLKAQSQQSAEQATALAALQLQIQQANQRIIQLQNQVSSAQSAALRMDAVAPAATNYVTPVNGEISQTSYAPPKATTVHFKTIEEFSTLLKNAGISVKGALQQVKGGDPSSYRAYSWKTDSLYGSAEMKKVTDETQFDSAVSQYLSRAKSRCSGEFAAVPSPTKADGMTRSKAYEIACVGQSASSSASVLFTYGNHIATTVAHEGRAEAMDLAIDARDKVSSKIN